MTSSPFKVGLLWHSPNSGNLGVGALTRANLKIARAIADELQLDAKFLIIGMRDDDPNYVTAEEADIYCVDGGNLLSPTGCWSVIGAQDCLLDIGAGDSFSEIYGMKRFFFLWLTKLYARMRGRPLVLSPQTIGPFTRTPYRQMASLALAGADVVVTRDRPSLDALGQLAPSTRGVLSVDVAFALDYEDQSGLRGGEKLRVGVNVSGMLFNEATNGRNRYGLSVDYALLMRQFIAGLAARPDVEVHLLTHVTASVPSWDDDSPVADLLASEFDGAIRVPNFASPSAAKSYISGLDFLVSGRMHACIAAFSAGTPVVPIAYSRKFSGLFGVLGYPWIVPETGRDTSEALAYLNACLDRRAELVENIRCGMRGVDRYLDAYRDELRRVFAAAAKRR